MPVPTSICVQDLFYRVEKIERESDYSSYLELRQEVVRIVMNFSL